MTLGFAAGDSTGAGTSALLAPPVRPIPTEASPPLLPAHAPSASSVQHGPAGSVQPPPQLVPSRVQVHPLAVTHGQSATFHTWSSAPWQKTLAPVDTVPPTTGAPLASPPPKSISAAALLCTTSAPR